MRAVAVTVWREVSAPVEVISDQVESALKALDPLRHAWEEAAMADPEGFRRTRLRTLRSHAIETGIIERLYDVSWGLTEALVAEGLALEVVQGAGNLDGDILAIINDQYEALEHVSDVAVRGRPLSVQFIRELHQIITRHQPTYEAIDSLGHITRPPLHHGEWKKLPNYLTRPNGERLECTPPERVQDQIESLVRYFNESRDKHPIVRAAWLHHSFMCIHPFEDGNGRVGRALVLLDLISGGFAPLVVGRDDREPYLASLDRANDGDLDELIIVMAELERRAMVRQFQAPLIETEGLGVIEVAKASSAKLQMLQVEKDRQRAGQLSRLTDNIAEAIFSKLETIEQELQPIFKRNDQSCETWVDHSSPGHWKAKYFHGQLVQLARKHDFYANLVDGSWWATLNLKLLDEQMRFLAAIVKVGAGETGVATMLVQSERLFKEEGHHDADEPREYEWLFEPGARDQVPFTYSASFDVVWPDVELILDRALAAAIAKFTQNLA